MVLGKPLCKNPPQRSAPNHPGKLFDPPQNQANARLYLDNSPLNRCPKPSWQGFRPPTPPNGQCPKEQRFSYVGASLKETSPKFWRMSNNYNFSFFTFGVKGSLYWILSFEYWVMPKLNMYHSKLKGQGRHVRCQRGGWSLNTQYSIIDPWTLNPKHIPFKA